MKVKALKAACLAVGLVTAWGSSANAGPLQSTDQIQLTITPSNNLTHVFFLYRSNATGNVPFVIQSLPDIPAGTTTTETLSVPPLVSQYGLPTFYSLLALHDESNNLVTVGCDPSWAAGVIGNADFNTEFYGYYPYTEDDMANALVAGDPNSHVLQWFLWEVDPVTPLGASSQLVNFSIASDGGSLSAQLIPEPSPIALVSVAALAILAFHRRRLPTAPFEANTKGRTHEG